MDWMPAGTDGQHSTNSFDCRCVWYNKNNPEYTITYTLDESRFDKGHINVIEHSMYWLKKSPFPLHNAYIYDLNIKFHSTKMFSTLAVFADEYRFKRVLWKNKTIFQNASNESILYSFIEKDSLEFQIDNWLNNHYETVWQTEESRFCPSLEPWLKCPEYRCTNPYNVVLTFKNADEHKEFIAYMKSKESEFMAISGDYNSENSKYKGTNYIKAAYPDYIDYLCKSGEMLVTWLADWRAHKP